LRSILDRIRGNPPRLRLLLFFYRRPRALLTGEQIVTYVGHEPEQVPKWLEGLIEVGLLIRSQNRSHAARLYALELQALPGGLLSSFLKIAATREGRLEVMRLFSARPAGLPARACGLRASLTKVA
jgi:hypothetical protein